MVVSIKLLRLCLLGPRLYKVHFKGPSDRLYAPPLAELWGDRIITSLSIIWRVGVFTSPLVAFYLYKRECTLHAVLKFAAGLGLVVAASICARTFGRLASSDYVHFADVLTKVTEDPSSSVFRSALRKYDFDFRAWPVDYRVPDFRESHRPDSSNGGGLLTRLLGQMAMKTFALKMIYPGSTSVLYHLVESALLQGRIRLVEEHNGRRFKIATADGNQLDCMFIDRRGISANGDTIAIASEGNAGFYEIGIMTTPIEAGYSVLGFNRPGFAWSTGVPLPSQERNAIDAVVTFADRELGFHIEDTILFGWSIGCYAIAHAAVRNPTVRGVIMDATFDDVLPLAINHMPPSLDELVTHIIREHVDLNIAAVLEGYPGPLKLIRRLSDEIIAIEPGVLSTNRGNDLLIKVLSHRYPRVIGEDQKNFLREFLSLKGSALMTFLSSERPGDGDKNQKALFLAEKYLAEYNSTHCTPLPPSYFQIPREVYLDEDFVFT